MQAQRASGGASGFARDRIELSVRTFARGAEWSMPSRGCPSNNKRSRVNAHGWRTSGSYPRGPSSHSARRRGTVAGHRKPVAW